MIKVPHHAVGLPRDFLSQLDPKLRELYSQLPPVLASRISVLVKQALPQRIHPNRVLKFAYLYATAERVLRDDPGYGEHTRRAKLELAGSIHGLGTGYRDDVEAKQRYRTGRRARQQIQASLESVLGKWRVFKQVVKKHRSELPVHVQPRFSDVILGDVEKILQNMGIATVVDEEDLARETRHERERSEIAQTYIWWHLKMPNYRGKWNDMHLLAFAWHMSETASVKSFRAMVHRICKGAPRAYRFEKSWESVLSEKL